MRHFFLFKNQSISRRPGFLAVVSVLDCCMLSIVPFLVPCTGTLFKGVASNRPIVRPLADMNNLNAASDNNFNFNQILAKIENPNVARSPALSTCYTSLGACNWQEFHFFNIIVGMMTLTQMPGE
jgi:hypothetical protein